MANDALPMTEEDILGLPVESASTEIPVAMSASLAANLIGYVESATAPAASVTVDEVPSDASRTRRLWRISVDAGENAIRPGLPGLSARVLTESEVAAGAAAYDAAAQTETMSTPMYRPPWLSLNPLPRVTLLPRSEPFRGREALPENVRAMLIQASGGQLVDTSYPWSTIGKVFVGSSVDWVTKWTGTGVLVGPNLLLTAGHVVPWGISPWFMRFVPAYNQGSAPYGESYVSDYFGYNPGGDVTGLDYAICRLYNPIGNNAGWLGSQSWGDDDPYERGAWTSVGYPATFFDAERPGVEYFIKIVDVDNEGDGRELEVEPFTSGGWSGGPLFGWINGNPLAIGVLSGRETDFLQPNYTVFAGGKPMVDLVKHGIANWPVT